MTNHDVKTYYVGHTGTVNTFFDDLTDSYGYRYFAGYAKSYTASPTVTGFATREEAEAHGFWAHADAYSDGQFAVDQDDRGWEPHPRPEHVIHPPSEDDGYEKEKQVGFGW